MNTDPPGPLGPPHPSQFAEPPLLSPESGPASIRPSKSYPGLAQSMGLVFLVGVLMVVIHVLLALVRGQEAAENDLWNLAAANTLGFLLIAWLARRRTGRPASEVFGLQPADPRLLLPLLFVSVAGMLVAAYGVDTLFRFMPLPESVSDLLDELAETLNHIIITALPSAVVAVVIVAPLTEEFFFRGLILQGFRGRYGDARAVVLSAALFGFFHLIPTQALYAFFVGLFLGWLRLRTGSLYPCLFVHAVVNGVAVVIMRVEAGREPVEPTGSSLPMMLGVLLVLILSVRWLLSRLPAMPSLPTEPPPL